MQFGRFGAVHSDETRQKKKKKIEKVISLADCVTHFGPASIKEKNVFTDSPSPAGAIIELSPHVTALDFHFKGLRRRMDANCGRHDLAREFPRIFF
jgi:hypothetical protein